MAGVIQSMGDIYKDMIADLFDTIIERSSDNVVFFKSWKSNQKHRIGVRIRKTRFIIPRFSVSSHSKSLDYESERFLSDIDKVFGYLHGVTGPYNGLVNTFKNSNPLRGERMPSDYFDCRFFAGTGTIHFYPKSDAVVDKINLFVGKMRNWLPGDMNEANDDFKKQFDKGESLTKEYLNLYKKSRRNTYGADSPVYALLQEQRNGEAKDPTVLDRLEQSIDSVHEQKGLHAGAALIHTRQKLHAIGFNIESDQAQFHSEPEQLRSLAA
jgi:hypothetical protein